MLLRPSLLLCAAWLASSAFAAQPSTSNCTPATAAAPAFTWTGKNVLWLGTSIPHQGAGRDGYPEQFCAMVGCRVVNNAFSGSHIRWQEQRADESCRTGRNAPKGLSATRRELQAKMQAALPDDGSSSYHDSCSRATRPLLMGYEDRINQPWSRTRFDVVVIDHGHNDRPMPRGGSALGELHPPELALSAVEKGRVTRLALPPGHGLQIHDDITVRTPGIPRMDYWTGEVSDVDGNTVTIPLDSSQLAGAYAAGGSVVRHDKSRLYDAYNLVISDVLHMNAFYGGPPVLITLVTPPTEWTGGRNDGSIAALNAALARIAGKWGLPVYDMTSDLRIDAANLRSYLPDRVHPTTPSGREFIARHMARWAGETRLAFDGCSKRWVGPAVPVVQR